MTSQQKRENPILLQHYLLRQFSYAMVYQTVVLVGIVYLIQSLRFFKWIALRQISLGEFFQLSVLLIPQFMSYLIPFACVFSMLYVFQQLKNKKELMALSVLGISDSQILRPIFFLILLIVALQIGLHLILPHAAQHFQHQERSFLTRLDVRMIKPKQFNTLSNAVIYVDEMQGNCVRNLFLYYEVPNKQFFITATSGTIKRCGQSKVIQLHKGHQIQWNTCTKTKQELSFASLNYDLGQLKSRKLSPAELVLAKKWRCIWRSADIPSQAEAWVRLIKIILPLLCFGLIFTFFAYRQFFLLAVGCCGLNLAMIGLGNILPLLLKV